MSAWNTAGPIPDSLRLLVNESVDGIVVVDVDGSVVHANERAAELVQLPVAEIVGEPFHTFFGSEVREKALACFSSFDVGQERLDLTTLSATDHPLRNIELRARKMEDGRTIAVLRDVGDVRRHQRALHILSHALSERPGQPFFDGLVQALVQALPVDYAFVGELLPGEDRRIRTLAFHGPDGALEASVDELPCVHCDGALEDGKQLFSRADAGERLCAPLLEELDIQTCQVTPLMDEHGAPIGVLGALRRDPAEEDPLISSTLTLVAARAAAEVRRRQTDEERRRVERHLRALVQVGSRFVWGMDADGEPTLGTMSLWTEVTGRDQAGATGEDWLDAVVEEDREEVARAWKQAWEGQEDVDLRYRVDGPKGIRHLHVRGVPIHDEDGAFEGYLGTIDDVTDHYKAAEDLRERNRVLRALRAVPDATHRGSGFLESIAVGMEEICTVSGLQLGRLHMQDVPGGPFRYSGVGFAAGGKSVERIGNLLVSPLEDEALAERVQAAEEPICLHDIALIDPGKMQAGLETWSNGCTALLVPVLHDGECVAILEFLADHRIDGDGVLAEIVSQIAIQLGRSYEREMNRRQMREAEKQARESQKLEAVGRLAGGIAHDFNNILMVISGEADLALRRDDVTDEVRGALEEIRESARRASSLTGQLLAFSRRELERPERVELVALVRETERMLRRIIGENVTLTTQGLDDERGSYAEVARGLLEQVLINLVVNAREAMPQGGSLTVSLHRERIDSARAAAIPTAEPGDYHVLSVGDTGDGIPDDIRESIFEPFFTTKEDGTGFGLSTSYGIVASAGGFIDFESAVGEGSVFRVHLPATEDEPAAGARRPGSEPRAKGSERVLVVEDDDGVRSVAIRILSAAGYQVDAARGRDDVEAYLADGKAVPEVLLTDCVLEKTTGREIDERIRGQFPEVATVFMSGYTDDVVLSHGVQPEGSAFLAKPFSPEALVASVERVLAERDRARAASSDEDQDDTTPRGS